MQDYRYFEAMSNSLNPLVYFELNPRILNCVSLQQPIEDLSGSVVMELYQDKVPYLSKEFLNLCNGSKIDFQGRKFIFE